MENSTNTEQTDDVLLERAGKGDADSLNELLTKHRGRLRRMVELRMDPRVRGRVDASDVIQEVYVEVSRKLPDYFRERQLPFFLWLRLLTGQKVSQAHRTHLGTQGRDAAREVSICRGAWPEASSAALAARLMGDFTSPSQVVAKEEMRLLLQDALNEMDETDREVLALRHFEQLSNSETAAALELSDSAACNRHVRALERMKRILDRGTSGATPCPE